VAIVSEAFERRFFPDRKAIGKRIAKGGPWMEIVGVVGNVKYLGLTFDTGPAYYMPLAQEYGPRVHLAVRSAGDAAALAPELRRVIQSIDSGATLAQIGTMEQALNLSMSRPRFNTGLLTLFAGIALLLAAIGIYGLMAYSVAQRTQEIGVRMALGATQADVLRAVVAQGTGVAAIGILIGLVGAFALTRLLATMLFGISVTDALTFAAAPIGTMLVVLLATFVPAFRATRISPVVALRYE
jgi:ABC-type antimicrobial peptide transport system permease subunit